jgi:uncharacterized small protein (DUF1192 family)
MDDDDRPVVRTDAASQLAKESLDSYSRNELDARILQLEAEIRRVREHREKSDAHRLAADALFRPKTTCSPPLLAPPLFARPWALPI